MLTILLSLVVIVRDCRAGRDDYYWIRSVKHPELNGLYGYLCQDVVVENAKAQAIEHGANETQITRLWKRNINQASSATTEYYFAIWAWWKPDFCWAVMSPSQPTIRAANNHWTFHEEWTSSTDNPRFDLPLIELWNIIVVPVRLDTRRYDPPLTAKLSASQSKLANKEIKMQLNYSEFTSFARANELKDGSDEETNGMVLPKEIFFATVGCLGVMLVIIFVMTIHCCCSNTKKSKASQEPIHSIMFQTRKVKASPKLVVSTEQSTKRKGMLINAHLFQDWKSVKVTKGPSIDELDVDDDELFGEGNDDNKGGTNAVTTLGAFVHKATEFNF